MNYLHGFHAGNFADVTKHIILSLILTYLKRKDSWFQVLDTHSGRGKYDLLGDQAQRTSEANGGIFRLYEDGNLATPIVLPDAIEAQIAPYRHAVAACNPDGLLRYYPGSPLVTLGQLRAKDRLFASELHAGEYGALRTMLSKERRVTLAHEDGYQTMKSVIPFTRKRGLVLIDPPYETPHEFDRALAAISSAMKRLPNGIYAMWYPLKSHHQADSMAKRLAKTRHDTDVETVLRTEIFVRPGDNDNQLNGSAMAIFNPPYTLAEDVRSIFSALQPLLEQEAVDKRRKLVIEVV